MNTSTAAAGERRDSIAIYVEGPAAKALRAECEKQLGQDFDVVSANSYASELSREGEPQPLGERLGSNPPFVHHVAAAATKAGAAYVLLVRPSDARFVAVHVVLVDAKTGAVMSDEQLRFPSKKQSAREKMSGITRSSRTRIEASREALAAKEPARPESSSEPKVGASSLSTSSLVPSSATPSTSDVPDGDRPEAHVAATSNGSRPLFEIQAGVETIARRFSYRDRVSMSLRDYDVAGIIAVSGAANVYPFARTGWSVVQDVGVHADYARAFNFDSSTNAGERVDTTFQRFQAGPEARIPLPLARRSHVSIGAMYGLESFEFSKASSTLGPGLPSVSYRYVRPGVGARIGLPWFAVLAGVGYRLILEQGEFGERFPRAAAGAIDATLGVGIGIAYGFEGRLGARYERYFYSLNPEVGDARVAGGALDQYFGGEAAIAYAF